MAAVAIDWAGMRKRQKAEEAKKSIPKIPMIPKEEDEWYEDFGAGIGVSGLELFYGLKELGVDLTEEDRAHLKKWTDEAEGGWGTAGQVVGEIGQMLVPGSAFVKGAKYIGKAAKAAKAYGKGSKLSKGKEVGEFLGDNAGMLKKAKDKASAVAQSLDKFAKASPQTTRFAKDATKSALLAGARLPEDEDASRGWNMIQDAGFSLGGSAAGKVITPLLKGAKKSAEGIKLLAEGVNLTPGRAAPGLRKIEDFMRYAPGIGSGIDDMVEEAIDQNRNRILNSVKIGGKGITKEGSAGVSQMKGQITDEYNRIWKSADKFKSDDLWQSQSLLRSAKGNHGDEGQLILDRLMDNIDTLASGSSKNKLNQIDKAIAKAMKHGKSIPYLVDDLKEVRKHLRTKLPKAEQVKLDDVDSKYASYLTLDKASGDATIAGGKFTLPQLANASNAKSTKAGIGKSPLYQQIQDSAATIGKESDNGPLSFLKPLAKIAPAPTTIMKALEPYAYGQGIGQKQLGDFATSELGQMIRPGRISPALMGLLFGGQPER